MIPKTNFLYSPFPAIAALGAGAGGAGAGAGGMTSAVANGVGIAGATASGLDVIGGQAFGIANLIMQKRAYEEQKAWQRYVYEDQKKLNDPSYIMNARRMAGLNPYGDFSGSMSTGQPTPVAATGVGDALNGLAGNLSRSTEKAFQAISKAIEMKQLQLTEKKLDNEILLTNEQRRKLRAETSYQDLVNEIAEATKDSNVKLSALQVEKALSDILLNNTNIQWLPEKFKAEIRKLNEDANMTNYNWTKYMPQMLLLNKALNASQIDLNSAYASMSRKQVEQIVEQMDNLHNQNWAMKQLHHEVESMKPGMMKSFMIAFLAMLENINPSMSFSTPK